MKIAIVDKIGLCYDGDTLSKQGLGGSESAVILLSKELAKIGFEVTVYNNCKDGSNSKPGIYENVNYIDNSDAVHDNSVYDIVVVSRTVAPFISDTWPFIQRAKKKILWLHDTFIEGDQLVENLVLSGKIDHIFTLSDWHTSYILNCNHGKKRNYEVLKRKIFQTRNGAVCHIPEVDLSKKDKNLYVYNASATKGMIPLIDHIWPEIKKKIPAAKLMVIGGYYRFREGAEPDAQENVVATYAAREDLKNLGITFTGVIPQNEIAEILSKSWAMLYPGAFPETFGISSIESLLYNTPLITTRFGALEEIALEKACYLIDYAIEPNSLFPDINAENQRKKFLDVFFNMYQNDYLHQQKQNYCSVIKDISSWSDVALQWKQFLFNITGNFLPVYEYKTVSRINNKVSRIFGRTSNMPSIKRYETFDKEKRIIVISPFRNSKDYLRNNILSVASQDYENYRHILIDDASDDGYEQILDAIRKELPESVLDKIIIRKNESRKGSVYNQLLTISDFCEDDDIVMLLDGDDWLINNNTIFKYYNDLYSNGYEFTYGSMHSLADDIPLISQEYPLSVKLNKTYRDHLFNWKIPYTHLRTCLASYFKKIDLAQFVINGEWMMSGADNPLFYSLIEQVEPHKIYCNKEIVCNYNDLNPLNDYKINPEEQNENANRSYKNGDKVKKKILVGIPTNKYIEPETFKSLWDLEVPEGFELEFQYFYGYQIDQVRNLIGEWARRYDYLLSIDSDIVLPKDSLVKMLNADKDIVSGLYIQRKPDQQTLEVYMDTPNGGCTNIPLDLIENISDIVEIAACGMGCALIKSEVFRKLDYPHFVYKSALNHADTVSEDVFFCLKARSNGFKIWADPAIRCGHIGQTNFAIKIAEKSPIEKNIENVYNQDLLPKTSVDYLAKMKSDGTNPKVIYDIGSCVLHWERHAKSTWPESDIYLFEANKDVKNLYDEKNKNYHLGVLTDADNREIKFYKDPMNLGGNSYYKENTEHYNESHATTEIGMTLDTIVQTNNWPLPNLIKLDVQGAELDILKGGKNCLLHCSDVILESQHLQYNDGAPLIDSVLNYMTSIGFVLVSNFNKESFDGDYHFKRF